MSELECTQCGAVVQRFDLYCPSCQSDLMEAGATRRVELGQESPQPTPEAGEPLAAEPRSLYATPVKDPFVRRLAPAEPETDPFANQPPFMIQGLAAGTICGMVFGAIAALLMWLMGSNARTAGIAQALLALLGFLPWMFSGVIIGLTMGFTQDFSMSGGAWAIWPIAVVYSLLATMVMGTAYALMPTLLFALAEGYMVGWVRGLIWAPSWDVG